jgi:hypothetical protein
MRKPEILSTFTGIAPAYGDDLKPGMAVTAENVDLRSGKIRPVKGPLLLQENGNRHNSMIFHKNRWHTGNDRHYLSWPIDGKQILFYLDGSILMKQVGNDAVKCGHVAPGKPTLASGSTIINLLDSDLYVWKKSVHGEDEYYCVNVAGGSPALDRPERLILDGEETKEGKSLGHLLPKEWRYGDNDTLGFETLYVRLPEDNFAAGYIDLAGNAYVWHASGTANHWYLTGLASADPEIEEPKEVLYGKQLIDKRTSTTVEDMKKLVKGTVGTLEVQEWGYDDIDTLGFDTIYVRFNNDPNTFQPSFLLAKPKGSVKRGKAFKDLEYSTGLGDISGEVRVVITTVRTVGGMEDESGPSSPSLPITMDKERLKVTRPEITEELVTDWKIYVLTTNAAEYLYVGRAKLGQEHVTVNFEVADLGMPPPSWYTSDQQHEIMFSPPPPLDGIAPEPYAGMILGWRGNRLFWSEPGTPDAWPSQYWLDFPAAIRTAMPFAGAVGVLTSQGPFRLDGTHPELLQASKVLGKEPCVARASTLTSRGVCYLSDSGLVIFNLLDTKVITDGLFGEDWFRENVSPTTATLVENDGILYLFHSKGTLRIDSRSKIPLCTTLGLVAHAASARADNGEVYVLDGQGIKQLYAGAVVPFTWKSGNLLTSIDEQACFSANITGSGEVTLSVYADGVLQNSKVVDFAMERGRTLKFPEGTNARAMQVEVSGTGEVLEIRAVKG